MHAHNLKDETAAELLGVGLDVSATARMNKQDETECS
jgi:hypothetical protein